MNSPKLAGQDSWYLKKQLQLFQIGARGTAVGDSWGMQMASMSKGAELENDSSLDSLVAYIGEFPDQVPAQTVLGDAERGEELYNTCISCHGKNAEGIEELAGPKLAGQNDWYLVEQIKKYQLGQRGYHNSDHGGRQMRAMAGVLSNEQEIKDVVSYINTLRVALP